MNRLALLGLASVVALGTVGCNTHSRVSGAALSRPRSAPTYALAVTVHGGLQPTPQQWAAIQAKLADELSWRGAVLVSDLSLAEKIIRLDFRPNPSDPENSGHLTLLGVRTNPYYGYARSGVLASSYSRYSPFSPFSQGFHHTSWWGSYNYYSGDYYNYIGPWENGYTSGGVVTVTPKPTTPKPPHRHDRNDREICPPDALHPRPTPSFASTEPSRTLSAGSSLMPVNNSPEPSRGRWTGERSAWRTEAAANRPATTYASSSAPAGTRGDRGYSRSSSASRSDSSSSRSDGGWWRARNDSYPSHSSSDYNSYSSSSSSGSLSASSSHVTPAYTSPSPSYSSSSSSSSGSFSTSSSSSSSSPSVTTTETSNTAER